VAVASAVGPAEIHAQQDLRPVLRLGAAGAGVELDDRVARVVGIAEHLLELDLRQLLGDFADLGGRFAERLFALLVLREIEKEARLFELGAVLLPRVEGVLDASLLFEDRLRLVGVVPEIGL
jgi:hypothetical protein